MNLKKIVLVAFAFSLVFNNLGMAQETRTKEASIEELYLSNPALRIAYDASRSDDRESKLLAISQLNELLEKGLSPRDEEQVTVILNDLASQGTLIVIREKGRLMNYFADVRREACRVLSLIKSQEAKKKAVKILINILNVDDDPLVKAQAASSLGAIGLNENEDAARAIANALDSQDKIAPNDNLAYTAMIAFEKLAKANNGIYAPEVSRIVVRIIQGNYKRVVKEKATEVLELLRSYRK